jgi:hypothetical protein
MNFVENNQKIIEAQLRKYIVSIAKQLKINISDWDFDSQLYSAILTVLENAHSSIAEKISPQAKKIDNLLAVADALNIKLNNEYYWYKNLDEINQITTKYGNY